MTPPYENPPADDVVWILRRFADRRTWYLISPSTAQMVARLLADRDKVSIAAALFVEALDEAGGFTTSVKATLALKHLVQAVDAYNVETPDQAEA